MKLMKSKSFESPLVRYEKLMGNNKVIVGNQYGDLVLETLGKVYIKSGKNFQLLNDVFDLLQNVISKQDEDTIDTIILPKGQDISKLEYPGEGFFIFDEDSQILYISVKGHYIALVNAKDFKDSKYVEKTGDTMSGQLTINTQDPPLIVASDKLVKNFNSQYLSGYSHNKFAKRYEDQFIHGSWTFKNKCISDNLWTFNHNIYLNRDLVSFGSLTSPIFTSGFSGSGWRLDGTTNTLTIDNLIVRKLFQVYEMIVNQIRATNGSLWVSNSSTCGDVKDIVFFNISEQVSVNEQSNSLVGMTSNVYYVPLDIYEVTEGGNNLYVNNVTTAIDGKQLSTNQDFGKQSNYFEFKYIYLVKDENLLKQYIITNGVESILNVSQIQNDENSGITVMDISNSSLDKSSFFTAYIENPSNGDPSLVDINIYYKYFGCIRQDNNILYNYYIIELSDKEYPVFQIGDILRCQKLDTLGSIKYYDALVVYQISSRTFLVQKAYSVFDVYSSIQYKEDGSIESTTKYNDTQYTRGQDNSQQEISGNVSDRLGDIQKEDSLIQIGNIQNIDRQGAIYLTSSDDQSPYIEILGTVNRPDYSVMYKEPVWIKYNQYFVSNNPSNESVYLGKFKIDENTNAILKENYIEEDCIILYGYTKPNKNCLVERIKNYEGIYKPRYTLTKTTKCRLGKLDGIYNYKLGNKQPYGFGLYADNAFLTGEFYLNNGKSVASFADDILFLSGKIEEIDPESIINEVENAFSATDEDGNPSGFAGLFTFDDGEEGGKGLAILGDTINFYNPDSNGDYNWESPTALISNGILNADLIDVKELEFDKLVGISNYNPEVLESLQFQWKENGEILLEGEIIGTNSPIPTVIEEPTSGNYIKNQTLYLQSFYVKTENGDIYKVQHNGELSDDWSSIKLEANSVIVDIPHIWYTDTNIPWNSVRLINTPISFELSVEPIYTAQDKEYNVISINKNSLGETILYYPDGSVLNAKIVSQPSDKSSVIGCVEYWFQQGSITPETLLNGGDSYVVNNYIDGGDSNSENYINGLIKRINYFNFVDKFGISWRTVLTGADSIDEWNALLTIQEEQADLESVFNYFNDLHEEASSGNGQYGSDYSIQISKILETFGKTPSVSSTVGLGIGNGIITWADSTTTNPVGMWFTYKLGLSDTINTYIEETNSNNNTLDKRKTLMKQTIGEGLHILNYSYTNGNTGRFDIEYFKNGKSSNSIVKRIRFTINNGVYNGVILAPTN